MCIRDSNCTFLFPALVRRGPLSIGISTGGASPTAAVYAVSYTHLDVYKRQVVDECFNEFLDDPAAHTLLGELEGHENLLLLRAFTKWYAMAGVRLGLSLIHI